MKKLLILLLLVPSLSWGEENKFNRPLDIHEFKLEVEHILRSEGYNNRNKIDKMLYQSYLKELL